ncbi:alpha/beta hydrolase [Aurantimonas marina]|uniref:alpha/beta hydrolase n=1 Tax=Aurantimonas marina TaxID=2780508 RepID=UPI0019D19AB8|nr:hypothetical protein [Aurantimonas marina]
MTERDEPALLAEHGLKHTGASLAEATRAMLCLHGRGATAEDILSLGEAIALPGIAYLAPQAEGGAWYPRPFMEPIAANEPFLSAALDRIGTILAALAEAGFDRETAEHLRSRRAKVTAKLYPEPGHAINMGEVAEARRLIAALRG